jgi:hypothetical protein
MHYARISPERRQVRRDPREGRGILTGARIRHRLPLLLTLAAGLALGQPARAGYPAGWLAAARCIHYAETGGGTWGTRWDERRNSYSRGGMQFLYSTWWRAVERHRLNGYPADPANASRAQQLFVAWLLYLDDGRSWHEWSTAGGCGLT